MSADGDEISLIRRLALTFRRAIEAFPIEERPPGFEKFPCGACEEASLLLGAYLADHGVQGFLLVDEDRQPEAEGESSFHAWLQRGALIVDITADQFRDAPKEIIVAEASEWHRLHFDYDFSELSKFLRPADFRHDSSGGAAGRWKAYRRIMQILDDPLAP